jgi:hypothetical protein
MVSSVSGGRSVTQQGFKAGTFQYTDLTNKRLQMLMKLYFSSKRNKKKAYGIAVLFLPQENTKKSDRFLRKLV